MYITINDIIGEKTIDLSYPIQNFDSSKEVAVISMFSDNIQYKVTETFNLKLIDNSEKQISNGSYTKREIDAIVGRKHILVDLSNDFRIIKMNKLAKVIDMNFNLNELDNSGNLKDGRPSDALFMYYVSSSKDFMLFEPQTPQYKKLKSGEIVSLTLRITDQNNNIITDGPGTTVVLHIHNHKIYSPIKNGIWKTIKPRMLPQNT